MKRICAAVCLVFLQSSGAVGDEIDGVDWISIGISTGKFSESISSRVFKNKAECDAYSPSEDHTCFPIPELPATYWSAQERASQDFCIKQSDDHAWCKEHGFPTETEHLRSLEGDNRIAFENEMRQRAERRVVFEKQMKEYDACKAALAEFEGRNPLYRRMSSNPYPNGCSSLAPWNRS